MNEEKLALAKTLARFTYVSSSLLAEKPKDIIDIKRDIVMGRHEQQEWLIRMRRPSADGAPAHDVGELIDELKRNYLLETNSRALREVQVRLVGDENVVMPGRYFIREGNITKINSNGETRAYRLFLFSDALLYASASSGSQFKVHRAIMLAFARVATEQDGGEARTFHILSPQKSVKFRADTSVSRQNWVSSIDRCIIKQRSKREEVLRVARDLTKKNNILVSQNLLSRLETTAAFLGFNPRALLDAADVPEEARPTEVLANHCHLCMRKYTFFNSPTNCELCARTYCSKCVSQRQLAGSRKKKKMCDGCFGLSEEYAHAQQSQASSSTLVLSSSALSIESLGQQQQQQQQQQPPAAAQPPAQQQQQQQQQKQHAMRAATMPASVPK
jgi:hypothetical protein